MQNLQHRAKVLQEYEAVAPESARKSTETLLLKDNDKKTDEFEIGEDEAPSHGHISLNPKSPDMPTPKRLTQTLQ